MTLVSFKLNGRPVRQDVEPRLSLADCIRDRERLTGTHLGCEHGVCGACTVEIDGEIRRSCITLAIACEGRTVRTIEGYEDDREMAVIRQAFHEAHGLQCGFCTPGMLITARDILRRRPGLDEASLRVELSGNLCRCTGYAGIVKSILLAAERLRSEKSAKGAAR